MMRFNSEIVEVQYQTFGDCINLNLKYNKQNENSKSIDISIFR